MKREKCTIISALLKGVMNELVVLLLINLGNQFDLYRFITNVMRKLNIFVFYLTSILAFTASTNTFAGLNAGML